MREATTKMTRRWRRPDMGSYPVSNDGLPQPDFGCLTPDVPDPLCDHLLWDFSANRCTDCGLRADPGAV